MRRQLPRRCGEDKVTSLKRDELPLVVRASNSDPRLAVALRVRVVLIRFRTVLSGTDTLSTPLA
jgi:hypothetical protein